MLRGFDAAVLPERVAGIVPTMAAISSGSPGTGRAMEQTFTHGGILYTLFSLFVNQILVSRSGAQELDGTGRRWPG
jgi:hypothetical protein